MYIKILYSTTNDYYWWELKGTAGEYSFAKSTETYNTKQKALDHANFVARILGILVDCKGIK